MAPAGRLSDGGRAAATRWRDRLGLSLPRIVVAALGVALVMLAGIAAVSCANMSRLVGAVDEMERSNDLLETVTRAYARVADAEASSRGYALTGDSAYLVAYRGAEAAVASVRLSKKAMDDWNRSCALIRRPSPPGTCRSPCGTRGGSDRPSGQAHRP